MVRQEEQQAPEPLQATFAPTLPLLIDLTTIDWDRYSYLKILAGALDFPTADAVVTALQKISMSCNAWEQIEGEVQHALTRLQEQMGKDALVGRPTVLVLPPGMLALVSDSLSVELQKWTGVLPARIYVEEVGQEQGRGPLRILAVMHFIALQASDAKQPALLAQAPSP